MTKEYIETNGLMLNEYLLIIQPSVDVKEKVNSIKKHFAAKYECQQAIHSKPHITLINFIQLQMNEQRIIGLMKNIIDRHSSFHITINGFGSFPTHTIYANIETKNSIVDVVKSLRPIQGLLKIDKEHKPHYITEPHLTIARKLLPWQYEKSWLEYSNTAFTAGFMATEVLLLRRNVEGGKYTTAATFTMQGLTGYTATQASLFI